MQNLTNNRKYLLLIPIVFLIISAFYFRWVTEDVSDALLRAKYTEIVADVDILAASLDHFVDYDANWDDYDYVPNVRAVVNFIDELPQTFAAAYRAGSDGSLDLVSDRFSEQEAFDPRVYAEFLSAVRTLESGDLALSFTPEGLPERVMLLRFRWIPTNPSLDGRFLVAAAVSYYSITTPMAQWVTWGQVVSIAVTFALETWLVILVARSGKEKP